jgi:hypothetical protein
MLLEKIPETEDDYFAFFLRRQYGMGR